MTTFVLVHGSWGGGWTWARVRPTLEGAGHRVLAPSLTGLADRSHLAAPEVGLGVHVRDIANMLDWEDVYDAVLVGHSYGGMVVTGVSAAVGGRLAQVVYLDAFAPETGQCAFDLLPWLRDVFASAEQEREWELAPLPFDGLGVTDARDLAWLGERSTPMSRLTHEEPLGPGSEEALSKLPVTYIHCAGQHFFAEIAQRCRERGFRVVSWPECGHMPMVTHPDELSAQLLALAAP